MDHQRERLRYKEIRVQAPTSSSNRSPWFFYVPSVKHLYTIGYLKVSNQFISSWVGNTKYSLPLHPPDNKTVDFPLLLTNKHIESKGNESVDDVTD